MVEPQIKLVRYDEARTAVQAARDVDEAKAIRDKADALRAYARQANDSELALWVSEIQLRARRRIGELSAELDKVVTTGGGKVGIPSSGKPKSEVLKSAGLSTSAAHRYEQLASVPEEDFERVLAEKRERGQIATADDLVYYVRRKRSEDERKATLTQPVDLPSGIYLGDFRQLSPEHIPDESVELVFTDPPYDEDSIELYEDAAREAARILKRGGSMIVYTGQRHLPAVLAGMSEHLRYWWTCAGVHEGGNQILQKLGVRCGWKPLLWFVKDTRGDVQNVMLDVVRGDREKDSHEWQQALGEARHFIDKLCPATGCVVDFFLGSGTAKIAAEQLGRRFIGFELDRLAAEKAAKRIREAT